MKQSLFIKNSPIDEKRISWIETIVSRLVRRARTRMSAVVAPYPISACIVGKPQGELLRYMFPLDGTLTKAIVHLNKKPKDQVVIRAEIEDNSGAKGNSFFLEKKHTSVQLDVQVKTGDRLIISSSTEENEDISEIWFSFLLIPEVSDAKVKSFLINELEESIEEEREEVE